MIPISLKQMAQRILRLLNAGDLVRDKKFEEREIILELRDAAHYIMKGKWFQDQGMKELGIPSHYITTFRGVEVQVDDQGNNYIDLPAEYIQLPMDMGIRSVWPDIGNKELDKTPMIPIPNQGMSLIYNSLPAGVLEMEWAFYVEQQKVYFETRMGKTLLTNTPKINKVKVQQVIISPEQVGLNDHFPAPPDVRLEIMKMVLQQYGMGEQVEKDLLNDNE